MVGIRKGRRREGREEEEEEEEGKEFQVCFPWNLVYFGFLYGLVDLGMNSWNFNLGFGYKKF